MRLPAPLLTAVLACTPFEGLALTPFDGLSLAFSLAIGFLRLLLARLMREGMVADVYQGPGGLESPPGPEKNVACVAISSARTGWRAAPWPPRAPASSCPDRAR